MDAYPTQYVGTTTFVMGQAPYDPRRQSIQEITAFAGGTSLPSQRESGYTSASSRSIGSNATATIADSLVPNFFGSAAYRATRTNLEANAPKVAEATFSAVSEVDSIGRQRVKLMAMKYADPEGISTELLARLDILNARLSQRAPRVSDAQVLALEQAAERLDTYRQRSDSRRARLNSLARA